MTKEGRREGSRRQGEGWGVSVRGQEGEEEVEWGVKGEEMRRKKSRVNKYLLTQTKTSKTSLGANIMSK